MLPINLAIILHSISEVPVATCGNLNHDEALTSVRLLPSSSNQVYNTNYLYITHWAHKPDSPNYPPFMICVGGGEEAQKYLSDKGVTCAFFDDSVSLAHLMSQTQDVFVNYSTKHNEYMILLMAHKPMQQILDFCTSFMNNYVFLLDKNLSVLESSSLHALDEKQSIYDTKQLKGIMQAIAEKIRENSQPTDNKERLLIEHVPKNDKTPEFYYCHSIVGKTRIATLVVCKTFGSFFEFSGICMQYLANLMQPCLIGRYSLSVKTHTNIRQEIYFMIEDKGGNRLAVLHNLSMLGWNPNDTYQIVYIQKAEMSEHRQTITPSFYLYENLFPDCIPVYDPTGTYVIVVVHNATDSLSPQTLAGLKELMTKNKLECRISLPFNDFFDLKSHFDLVKSSLFEMSEHRENVTMYRDVMPRHIISNLSSLLPVHALCHPAAVKLYQYDSRNGTELLVTLEKYLLYNKSIQKAGEELYIHRNTIVYRKQKIEEITGLSLNPLNNYLHLLLSCIVLRTLDEL